MLTATKGVFGTRGLFTGNVSADLVVSDIPAGLFIKKGKQVALVGHVLGNTAIQTPLGGEILLPHLKYVGAYFCEEWLCAEIVHE